MTEKKTVSNGEVFCTEITMTKGKLRTSVPVERYRLGHDYTTSSPRHSITTTAVAIGHAKKTIAGRQRRAASKAEGRTPAVRDKKHRKSRIQRGNSAAIEARANGEKAFRGTTEEKQQHLFGPPAPPSISALPPPPVSLCSSLALLLRMLARNWPNDELRFIRQAAATFNSRKLNDSEEKEGARSSREKGEKIAHNDTVLNHEN